MRSLPILVALVSSCALAGEWSLTLLPQDQPHTGQLALATSGDGDVVIGITPIGESGYVYKFSPAIGLALMPGSGPGTPMFLNPTGTFAYGSVELISGRQASRWIVEHGAIEPLPLIPGFPLENWARGALGNGVVIEGNNGTSRMTALWDGTATTPLSDTLGTTLASGLRCWTPSFSHVGGYVRTSSNTEEAFVHQVGGATTWLPLQPGANARFTYLRDVSEDGTIWAGTMNNTATGSVGFVWTESVGYTQIAATFGSYVQDMDASGQRVVGFHYGGVGVQGPFLWTQATGAVRIRDLLAANGVTFEPNFELTTVQAISADGYTVVGEYQAQNGDVGGGYVAVLGRPLRTYPHSYIINSGFSFQGDLDSVRYSDGERLELFPSEETLVASIDFRGTAQPSSGPMRLEWETSVARPGLAGVVFARNFAEARYDVLHGAVATFEDARREHVFSPAAKAAYIGNGRAVRCRIEWYPINDEDPAQDGWIHSVDLCRWVFPE